MAFNLPVPEGDAGASFTGTGLMTGGTTIPYQSIKKFRAASDDELEVILHDKDEEGESKILSFQIEDGCSHQLLDLQTFVETSILQQGFAVMDEPLREKIVGLKIPGVEGVQPMPIFDMKKVRRSFARAYTFGA